MITTLSSTIVLFAYQTAGAPTLDARPTPGLAPVTGAVNAGSTTVAGGAAAPGAADAAAPASGNSSFLIIMLLIVGGMIVFSLMGGRKERKKREAMLSTIKKHDRVLTVGGILGSVVELKDDTIIIKVDETTNTRLTVSKTAISQVLANATGSNGS
jgi:preprotein translocase subunit YajC